MFFFFLKVNDVHSRCETQFFTFNFTKNYIMTERQKKIKGSAVVDEEGFFVFTPYGTREGENKGMKLVLHHENGTVWVGKDHYALRIRVPRLVIPRITSLVQVVIHLYSALLRYEDKHPYNKKGGRK